MVFRDGLMMLRMHESVFSDTVSLSSCCLLFRTQTGFQGDLTGELRQAGSDVLDFETGGPMFNLRRNFEQDIGEVEVDLEHRYISGISMIADR